MGNRIVIGCLPEREKVPNFDPKGEQSQIFHMKKCRKNVACLRFKTTIQMLAGEKCSKDVAHHSNVEIPRS